MPDKRIVKVQRSLSSASGKEYVLIYDQTREWINKCPLSIAISNLVKAGGKKYFIGEIDKNRLIILREEVGTQAW